MFPRSCLRGSRWRYTKRTARTILTRHEVQVAEVACVSLTLHTSFVKIRLSSLMGSRVIAPFRADYGMIISLIIFFPIHSPYSSYLCYTFVWIQWLTCISPKFYNSWEFLLTDFVCIISASLLFPVSAFQYFFNLLILCANGRIRHRQNKVIHLYVRCKSQNACLWFPRFQGLQMHYNYDYYYMGKKEYALYACTKQKFANFIREL